MPDAIDTAVTLLSAKCKRVRREFAFRHECMMRGVRIFPYAAGAHPRSLNAFSCRCEEGTPPLMQYKTMPGVRRRMRASRKLRLTVEHDNVASLCTELLGHENQARIGSRISTNQDLEGLSVGNRGGKLQRG